MTLAGIVVRQAIAVDRTARWDHRGTAQLPPTIPQLRLTERVPRRLPTTVAEAAVTRTGVATRVVVIPAEVVPAAAPLGADTLVEVAGATLVVVGNRG